MAIGSSGKPSRREESLCGRLATLLWMPLAVLGGDEAHDDSYEEYEESSLVLSTTSNTSGDPALFVAVLTTVSSSSPPSSPPVLLHRFLLLFLLFFFDFVGPGSIEILDVVGVRSKESRRVVNGEIPDPKDSLLRSLSTLSRP